MSTDYIEAIAAISMASGYAKKATAELKAIKRAMPEDAKQLKRLAAKVVRDITKLREATNKARTNPSRHWEGMELGGLLQEMRGKAGVGAPNKKLVDFVMQVVNDLVGFPKITLERDKEAERNLKSGKYSRVPFYMKWKSPEENLSLFDSAMQYWGFDKNGKHSFRRGYAGGTVTAAYDPRRKSIHVSVDGLV